jgi:osmotically-inducible protein OsmY
MHGIVGKIDHLLVHAQDGEISHLVVRRGFLPYYLVVPVSWIETVNEEGVFLRGNDEQLNGLPRHRARVTADILAEVQDRLDSATQDFSGVTVSFSHGILYLHGIVKDAKAIRVADEIARSSLGVMEVDNLLCTTSDVASWVAEALAMDPRTAEAVIGVSYDRGIVTLQGEVKSNAVHAAAEEIAYSQEGVISVVNALEVEHTQGRSLPAFEETVGNLTSVMTNVVTKQL